MSPGRGFRLAALRPSYGNVIATIALFLALGGGAYAGVTSTTATSSSPGVRVYSSTSESFPTFTGQAVTFNKEAYDQSHMHSSAHSTRLVAPLTGVYDITGDVEWGSSAAGERDLWIEINGHSASIAAETTVAVNSGSNPTDQMVETQTRLHKGDYVELWGYQGSGSSLNLDARPPFLPSFAMHFLGK
jgi:hypothetical protein